MSTLLNIQWEKFCLSIFTGKSGQDAAIEAGYSVKAARQIASRLLTKANIVARLQELQAKAASAKIMDVVERKERLTEIARETVEGKFGIIRQGNLQAIAELNKMEGEYAPQKAELTGKDGAPLIPPVIQVLSLEAKALTEQIIQGKGTET